MWESGFWGYKKCESETSTLAKWKLNNGSRREGAAVHSPILNMHRLCSDLFGHIHKRSCKTRGPTLNHTTRVTHTHTRTHTNIHLTSTAASKSETYDQFYPADLALLLFLNNIKTYFLVWKHCRGPTSVTSSLATSMSDMHTNTHTHSHTHLLVMPSSKHTANLAAN